MIEFFLVWVLSMGLDTDATCLRWWAGGGGGGGGVQPLPEIRLELTTLLHSVWVSVCFSYPTCTFCALCKVRQIQLVFSVCCPNPAGTFCVLCEV